MEILVKDMLITLSNGLKMPRLGFGTMKITNPKPIVEAIIKNGYRHLDTAVIYKNELVVGEALQEVFATS